MSTAAEQFTLLEVAHATQLDEAVRDLVIQHGGEELHGIWLWEVDELVERNSTYETAEYTRGHVALGTDGGGRLLFLAPDGALSLRDAGSPDPADAEVLAGSVASWVAGRVEAPRAEEASARVDVVLTSAPPELSALLRLKRALALDISIADLKAASTRTPAVVATGLPRGWTERSLAAEPAMTWVSIRDADGG